MAPEAATFPTSASATNFASSVWACRRVPFTVLDGLAVDCVPSEDPGPPHAGTPLGHRSLYARAGWQVLDHTAN